MKKTGLLLFLLFVISSCSTETKLLNPESVCFDYNSKIYFVSNYGDGSIVKIDKNNRMKPFVSGYSRFMGIAYKNDIIYVAQDAPNGDDYIRAFNAQTAEEVNAIKVIGSKQLNDIAIDNKGNLYVSDRIDHKIYKVDLTSASYEVILDNTIDTPNGVYLKAKENKLLICNTVLKSSIYELDLDSYELNVLHRTNYSYLDGITVDEMGNIYVSSWSENWKSGKLIKLKGDGKATVILESEAMADINYNVKTKSIDIANFLKNSIQSIRVR